MKEFEIIIPRDSEGKVLRTGTGTRNKERCKERGEREKGTLDLKRRFNVPSITKMLLHR